MHTSRLLDDQIRDFICRQERNKPVLMVSGARQVGKTTLIENALKKYSGDHVSINLEKHPLFRKQIDDCGSFQDLETMLEDNFGYGRRQDQVLFIDEAQESSMLGQYIRFMKEDWEQTTVIISGSTLNRIFRDGQRYPVGRVETIKVSPYVFSEHLRATDNSHLAELLQGGEKTFSVARHQRLLELYDSYLLSGGLPGIVKAIDQGKDPEIQHAQILADYEQDFIRIFGEDLAEIASRCLKATANLSGSAFKNSQITPNATTEQNQKINNILHRLEAWSLILKSEQKGANPEASQRYHPKRYLFDTGLLRHIREIAVPSISLCDTLGAAARTPLGGVLENQTAMSLAFESNSVLTGWKKTTSGGEIDFIIKRGNEVFPVECKASLRIDKRMFKGIFDYLKLYDLPKGFLVSFAPWEKFSYNKKEIVNIPAYLLENI